jgi:hypothetical protein
MDDGEVLVGCEKCSGLMSRAKDRHYASDKIMIHGDTCSGSCNFSNYFDEGLDTYVSSRDHRKEIMKERKLTEYEPNPEALAARKEARYILDNAPKNDATARKAAKAQSKAVHEKRTKRVVDNRIKKARKDLNL